MGNWTRACCDDCWVSKYPGMYGCEPTRLKENFREVDKCGHCGRETLSGIYVRIDPKEQFDNDSVT